MNNGNAESPPKSHPASHYTRHPSLCFLTCRSPWPWNQRVHSSKPPSRLGSKGRVWHMTQASMSVQACSSQRKLPGQLHTVTAMKFPPTFHGTLQHANLHLSPASCKRRPQTITFLVFAIDKNEGKIKLFYVHWFDGRA